MEKFFTKGLFFIVLFKLLLPALAFGQTITVNNVDPGPYGQGSTIGVPIRVDNTSGCTKTDNIYNLYLSDASGNFGNETLIGSFSDFYATFVNGIIPVGTPAGNNYKVRVIGTSPIVISTASNAFNITSASGVTAKITSPSVINASFPEVFGSCNGVADMPYSFTNQSTAGSVVTASFLNEFSHAAEGGTVNLAPNGSFIAKATNYTISVKATNGGIVGTKEFILINNAVNNSFGASGSNAICLNSGVGLTYNVDFTSETGIQNNFPGLTYSVTWGDGTASSYTYCDIVAFGGKITHLFEKSSCGNSANGQNNSFEVDLQPMSKYCGANGTKVTSYAKVIAGPINLFSPPVAACVNSQVTITNTSYPGDDPNNTSANCVNAPATYTWLVDGKTVGINYTLSKALQYTFTTAGVHSITLHLEGNGTPCTDEDVTHTICIQNPPKPIFNFAQTKFCAPATVKPINTSQIDANCNTENKYTWAVNGPVPVQYANGTNQNSFEPEFLFTQQGNYNIKLGITTASCGVIVSAEKTVTIDDKAVAKLSPDIILCGNNQVLNFNPTPGPTQTTVTGTTQSASNPFNWTVTGGSFAFTNGTNSHSQYPQITFNDNATYTITVSNTNLCGVPASDIQKITFQQAPTVDAGKDQIICSNETVQLNGTISGGVNSTNWTGGNGTFSPDRNALKPIYTPSADEIAAGTVTLTLNAITSLAPPCNSIARNVTITIAEPVQVTSDLTKEVCSNTPLNYQIVASIPNSTFTWQVDPDPAKTTPSASGYTANGSGDFINDAIVNSDPVNYAIVTYNISATGPGGCTNVFPLVVSVAPQQTISKFTSDVTSGCGDLTVQFTNASIPSNSTYVWDFGDGSLSTDANPSHVFTAEIGKDKTYTVTLFATSNCGNSVPYKTDILVRPQTPLAYINPEDLIGCSPFTLKVHNLTDADNVKYDFYLYDGATQIQKITTTDKSDVQFDPITVPTTKQYNLYMIATNACGTTGQSPVIPITISATNIKAQVFPENGIKKGCVPLTVNLVNNSVGGDTYHYHIYDANNVEIDRQLAGSTPQPYVFKTPGTYSVTVSAENSCSTIESAPWQFDIYPIPVPDFSADVTTACKNLLVTFTNKTPDDINTQAEALLYDWDFGDGGPHSFAFTPPPHLYTYTNSPYTVTLTATNRVTNCTDVITKTNLINVTAPPATAFTAKPGLTTSIPNYHFEFIDETPGPVSSWLWTFGDGTTSTSQFPGHTYADVGTYDVTLVASSKAGCDFAVTHQVQINGVPGELYLPNAFEPTGGTVELRTFKAKGVGIATWKMQIFNNYAQLIWETTKLDAKGSPVEAWDGTYKGVLQPQGVYVWQVSATFINGTEWKGNSLKNELPKRTGVIHLIR